MKHRIWLLIALITMIFIGAQPAAAQQRLIVRTTKLPLLQQACLLNSCKVIQNLDGTLNQLFLVTVPNGLPLQIIADILDLVPGVLDVEVDLVRQILPGEAETNSVAPSLSQQNPMSYYGSSVWTGYAQQPATSIIQLGNARNQFQMTGSGIIADIDTGVDFSHPVLKGVLLPGYDFTRNQLYGNEMADVAGLPAAEQCSQCQPAQVNQSTAAVLDQSTAAVLDSPNYAAFGHGTMAMGVLHLIAPTAQLMPLKAFSANGDAYTSNIIRGIYYAVQNHANVINMSFDFTSSSNEVATAIKYAGNNNVICVASAGNDGKQETVYPAALPNVMGVASTTDQDTRSTFSNYGPHVWVAAPGEDIVTTYPYDTYASTSGTSFSAPMVSGTASLILQMDSHANQLNAATAIGRGAKPLTPSLGNGLLDVFGALSYEQVLDVVR
ncbi:MAG: S8 family serine peptidase [Candidatus Acidiferrales bacterium]